MPTIDGIYKGVLVPRVPWHEKKAEAEETSPPVPSDEPPTCSECGKPIEDHRCERCGLDL